MTLEELYPIAGERLAVIRDPRASVRDKRKAAKWLIEHGFDRHPLANCEEIDRAFYSQRGE